MTAQVLSAAACAAAVCAGAAAWLLAGDDRGARRAGLLLAVAGGKETALTRARWAPRRTRAWGWVLGLGGEWLVLPAAASLAVLGQSVLPLVGGGIALPLVRRWLRARERGRARKLRAERVVALCGAAVAELRAGGQPLQALLAAAGSTGGLGGAESAVLAAARFGGDVPAALRLAAREPGADGLVGLAACWRVAVAH